MKKLLPLLLCMLTCSATSTFATDATDYLGMLKDVNGNAIDVNKYYAITQETGHHVRGVHSDHYRMFRNSFTLGVQDAYYSWQFEAVSGNADGRFRIVQRQVEGEKNVGYIGFEGNLSADGGGNIRPNQEQSGGVQFGCTQMIDDANHFQLFGNQGTNVCYMGNSTSSTSGYLGKYESTNNTAAATNTGTHFYFTPLLVLTWRVEDTAGNEQSSFKVAINGTTITLSSVSNTTYAAKMTTVAGSVTSISLGSTDLDTSISKYVVTVNGTDTEYTNAADAIFALNGRIGLDATLTVVIDKLAAARATAAATLDSYKTIQGDYYRYDDADIEDAKKAVANATTESAINAALTSLVVKHPITDGAIIKLWSNRNAYMFADDGLKIQANVDVKNIWVAKAVAGKTDQFYLYNPYTGKYAGSTGNNSGNDLANDAKIPVVEEANACPYSFEAEYPYVKVHDMSSGRSNDFQYLHAVSANNVVHWRAQSYTENADSYWKLYDISYDEVSASFHALADANKLNEAKNHIGTKVGQLTFDTNTDAIDAAINANSIKTVIAALPASKFIPTLNLPRTNMFIRLKSVANSKYATFTEGMTETYDGPASAPNALLVSESDNNYVLANTLFYIDNDKHLIGYSNGRYGDRGLKAIYVGSTEKSVYTFAPSSNQANFTGFHYMTVCSSLGWYPWLKANDNSTVNDPAYAQGTREWQIEEAEELPVQFKAAAKGYATLYTPVALDMPQDGSVKAYTGTFGENVIVLESLSVIPAGTAVLLKKTEAPAEDTWVNFHVSSESGDAVASNRFHGHEYTFTKPAAGALTLGRNDAGNIGFYNYTGTTIRGFSAYCDIPAGGGVRGLALYFGGDVETAIQTVLEAEASGVAYDLSGRRVEKAQNGIYIVNGKKIVVK